MVQEHSIQVVPAAKIHIPEIAGIEELSFAVPWPKSAMYEELHLPFSHFYAAINTAVKNNEQPSVLGYIIFWIIEDELQILNIAVAKHYRRHGVAQMLLDVAFKIARRENVSVMFLEVRKSNIAAIKLYEKNGFHVIGVRKAYYSNNNEDALVMVWKPE